MSWLYWLLPFLFKKCPAGQRHWLLTRYCHCRAGAGHRHVWDFREGRAVGSFEWAVDVMAGRR